MLDALRKVVIVATLFLLGMGQACACVSHSPAPAGHMAAASHDMEHDHCQGEPDVPDPKCCDGKTTAIQPETLIQFKSDQIQKTAPVFMAPINAVLRGRWEPAPAAALRRLPVPRSPTLLNLKIRLQN